MTLNPIYTFCRGLQTLLIIGLLMVLAGCSWWGGKAEEQPAQRALSALEVPPDLITPQGDPRLAAPELPDAPSTLAVAAPVANCRCAEAAIGERVLPPGKDVQRMRDGRHRWLEVAVEPEQVWPLVRKFLTARGYRISRDEPGIGLLETDWKDRFADTQTTGAPTWRERLRARIEPAARFGSTEIYLSQRNSEHVIRSADSDSQWLLRAPDEERAVEMLNRLARFLTAEEVQDAVPLDPLDARLGNDGNDGLALIVDASFDMVWRRTGIALEALGFTIEDYDRANRLYRVYNEMSSGLTPDDLKYGKPRSATVRENFHIQLHEQGDQVQITVRSKDGQVESSSVASHLLTLLRGEFQ